MCEEPLLEIRNVRKKFMVGETGVDVLKGCSMKVFKGEIIAVVGRSGSGKTTLLNILGGLDCPDEGEVLFKGYILPRNNKSLTQYRKSNIGFVLQQYGLVSDLSVFQNVEIVRRLVDGSGTTDSMLESVGMLGKKKSMPFQLSGGEQQRVAIARALIKGPSLLLCDEPTGALDASTGDLIIGLIAGLAKELNQTVITVTHDSALCGFADRVVMLEDGILKDAEIPQRSALSF